MAVNMSGALTQGFNKDAPPANGAGKPPASNLKRMGIKKGPVKPGAAKAVKKVAIRSKKGPTVAAVQGAGGSMGKSGAQC